MTLNIKIGGFMDILAIWPATHISRANYIGIARDRLGQPAYETFSECWFKFRSLHSRNFSYGGVRLEYPL